MVLPGSDPQGNDGDYLSHKPGNQAPDGPWLYYFHLASACLVEEKKASGLFVYQIKSQRPERHNTYPGTAIKNMCPDQLGRSALTNGPPMQIPQETCLSLFTDVEYVAQSLKAPFEDRILFCTHPTFL